MKKWIAGIFITSLLVGGGVQFQNNYNDDVVYANVFSVADENYIHNQLLVKTLTDMNVASSRGSEAFSFPLGYGVVEKNGRYSYIDTSGDLKYPWAFTDAGLFQDSRVNNDSNIAMISVAREYVYLFEDKTLVGNMGSNAKHTYETLQYAWLQTNGTVLMGDPPWGGYIVNDGVIYDAYEGDIFTIESTNRLIPNPPNFYDIQEQAFYYSEGIRAIKWSNGWGFIDKNANITISPQYADIGGGLSEGLIAVKKNGKWGYINSSNQTVIPFIYDDARGFDDNRALVKKDGYWHIIKHPSEVLTQNGINSSNLADFSTNIIKSNITFDSNTYNAFQSAFDHVNYLSTQIAGVKNGLNSEGVNEVNNYITTIINNIEPVEISVHGSDIHVLSPNYNEILQQSKEVYENLEDLLNDNNLMTTEIYEQLQPLTKGLGSAVTAEGSSADIDNISQYAIVELPNITFDFDTYSTFISNEEHIDYLKQQINSISDDINKLGLEEIEKYVEYILKSSNVINLKATRNTVNVNYKDNSDDINSIVELNKSINNILDSKNIVLNKKVENNIIFNVSKIDLEKAVTYKFSSDLLPYLDYIDGIRLIISNNYNGLYTKSQDLISNLNTENLSIEVNYFDSSNIVVVVKNGGEIVYKTDSKFFITTQAENKYSTVFSTIDNNNQNWGGQFNPNTNTIEFGTNFTGSYEVKTNNVIVNDIDHLSEDLQNKIKFMISKGILSVDGDGDFNPDNTVQRYHFITALVRLLFALDEQATIDFTDVPKDSPYYKMVASAKLNEITNGYDDNTFRGENIVTREEIVSFVSRKLAEEKGYKYPDNADSVLSIFKDTQDISDWSKNDIALAVEHNLIKIVGEFDSKEEITRLETIDLLYALFMNLYVNDELPAYTENDSSSMDSNTTLFLLASGFVILIGLGVGSLVINKGKDNN